MSMRDQYENLDQYALYDYKDVSNAYGHGEDDALNRVLDILDEAQTYKMAVGSTDLFIDREAFRDEVLALKGEHG